MVSPSEQRPPDLEALRSQALIQGDAAILLAVNQKSELIQQLLERLQQDWADVEPEETFSRISEADVQAIGEDATKSVDENIRLRSENSRLNQLINRLECQLDALSKSHRDLAQRLVYESVAAGETPLDGMPDSADVVTDNALTWEERLRQIRDLLRDETLDADELLSTLEIRREHGEASNSFERVIEYVVELNLERSRLHDQVRVNEHRVEADRAEINMLREQVRVLEESLQSDRAAALSELSRRESADADDLNAARQNPVEAILDADAIIAEERERLRWVQQECEQQVRETEIQASLERAKLSRQCTELQHQLREMAVQLESLRCSTTAVTGEASGSKWMAKLGLTSQPGNDGD